MIMPLILFNVTVPKCLNNGIIVKLFPLHDKEELKRLEKEWYFTVINIQPLGIDSFI